MFEAVVRTRFSRGFRISSFVTPVLISNNDLLICSNLDSDQSYTVGIDLSDDPNNIQDNLVYIQVRLIDFLRRLCYTLIPVAQEESEYITRVTPLPPG